MAKLIIFPDKKREETRESTQRKWLEQNQIPVVEGVAWKWTNSSWFRRRLAKVRAEGTSDG